MAKKRKNITTAKEKQADEVSLSLHLQEFMRFYAQHKGLCDELSGVKARVIMEDDSPKKIRVTKQTFSKGIKRLYAFIIDNLQYLSAEDRKNIESEIEDLETRFVSDKKYQGYVENARNLTEDEEIAYLQSYLAYLLDCYELSYLVFTKLQGSMMITTTAIRKQLRFFDYLGFYQNLAEYRDEVSFALADYRFARSIEMFKKITGYCFTYKFLLSDISRITCEKLQKNMYEYLMLPEVRLLYVRSQDDARSLSPDEIEEIRKASRYIRKGMARIYFTVNESLMERNILPKIQKTIIIDKTGI